MQVPRVDQLMLVRVPTAITCARLFVEVTLRKWRLDGTLRAALAALDALLGSEVNQSSGQRNEQLQPVHVRLIGIKHAVVVEVWDDHGGVRRSEIPISTKTGALFQARWA